MAYTSKSKQIRQRMDALFSTFGKLKHEAQQYKNDEYALASIEKDLVKLGDELETLLKNVDYTIKTLGR